MIPHAKQTRRLRAICILIIIWLLIPLVRRLILWIFLPSSSQQAFLQLRHWVMPLFSITEAFLLLVLTCVVVLVNRANLLQATRQRIALIMIPILTATRITSNYFYWHVISSISRPPGTRFGDRPTFTPLQEFVLGNGKHWTHLSLDLAVLLCMIVLILPPGPKLAAWRPNPELILRLTIVTALAVNIISKAARGVFLAGASMAESRSDYTQPLWLKSIRSLISTAYPYQLYATTVLLIFILVLVIKRAKRHIPSTNHCASCAYPLDQLMTTCPECGTKRPAQPAPTTPLPEG